MKHFKKSALLFVSIMALAAFAMPAMASAAVWGPALSTGHLHATSWSQSSTEGPGWTCSTSDFGYKVRSPASTTLDITSATWTGCNGTGTIVGCSVTLSATGLPWTATGTTTSNIQTNYGNVNGQLGGTGCPTYAFVMTGAVGSTWTSSTHSLTSSSAPGLHATVSGIPWLSSITSSGVLRDTLQTLTLT